MGRGACCARQKEKSVERREKRRRQKGKRFGPGSPPWRGWGGFLKK